MFFVYRHPDRWAVFIYCSIFLQIHSYISECLQITGYFLTDNLLTVSIYHFRLFVF